MKRQIRVSRTIAIEFRLACYAVCHTRASSMRPALVVPVLLLGMCVVLAAFQATFRQFPGEEDNPSPLPADAYEKTEWAFARLMYPSSSYGWNPSGTWPTDFPKADRQFVQGVRRLTRLHTRSTEQVVDLDTDEIFNWPWMYAVEV